MMTKTQYAKCLVKEFCERHFNDPDYTRITDWEPYIHSSSRLAVALEFLGLLTEEQKEYSSTRGGVLHVYFDEPISRINMSYGERYTHITTRLINQSVKGSL